MIGGQGGLRVIYVTRLNGGPVVVNAAAIEFVEATPDTRLTLASGRWIMVRESIAEVVERVTAYYARVGHPTVVTRAADEPVPGTPE